MAILGCGHPIRPIINRPLVVAAAAPAPIGKAYLVSYAAVTEAAECEHTKDPGTLIVRRLASGAPIPPPIGKQTLVSWQAVDQASIKQTDLFKPIFVRLRPPDPVKVPALVGYDPKGSVRSRGHEEMVANILNSLIIRKELVSVVGQPARRVWTLGYTPNVLGDWDSPPPTTLADAIDRLAAALEALVDLRTRVGNGPPPSGLGNLGDTYVDIDTGDFYWNL